MTRATSTTLDVMLERRTDDYWSIEGNRDPSDSWTGFTRFTILEEKPPSGYTWSGRRLTKKQTTSRPDYLCPEMWQDMPEASQRKEKRKWADERPKLDNGGHCAVFTSLIQRIRRRNYENRAEKVGSSDASSNALQDQVKNVQGNLSQS